jgi:hypothetical protein
MTVLVESYRRLRSAENRVPHQTRWGTRGSQQNGIWQGTVLGSIGKVLITLRETTLQTAPTVLFIVWNIFR